MTKIAEMIQAKREGRLDADGNILPERPLTPAPEPSGPITPYAMTALESEVLRVLEAPEGTRNDTLNKAAFSLGQLVGGGLLARHVVEDALTTAALENGLEASEVAGTIRSGINTGMRQPRRPEPRDRVQAPPTTVIEANVDDADALEFEITQEVRRLRVRQEARKRLHREGRAGGVARVESLEEALLRPPAAPYRVARLLPSDASMLVVAQRKTGKSTWALNLCHSLITGDPFLGSLDVLPITGTVAYLNYEVSGYTLASWANDIGVDPKRCFLVNLRGLPNPLDDPEEAAALAAELRMRNVETIVVDTFTRAYTGTSENDAGEVGAWLNRLAQWARGQAGARDLILTAHAGWSGDQGRGTRARGSSALEDWPDSIVYLTRTGDDEDGPRYMRATGRDVDLPEDALDFDDNTRRMTLTGTGSRKQASEGQRVEAALGPVFDFVLRNPGSSTAEIERGLGKRKGSVTGAVKSLVDEGLLVREKRTKRGGGWSFVVSQEHAPTSPNPFPDDLGTSPNLPYRGEVPGATSTSNLPRAVQDGEAA